MTVDVDPTDPLALRVAARSGSKSMGRLWRLVRSSLALVWSSGKGLLSALIAVQVLAAVALAAQVLTVERVLSAILDAQGDQVMDAVLVPVVVLATLAAVAALAAAVQGQLQRLLGESVARTMWGKVLSVATGVGLRYFESPDFYNRLNRVQTSAMLRPHQVTQGLLTMGSALAACTGLGVTLFLISPVLLPLVVVAGIPLLITSSRESRLEFEFSVRQTPAVRLRGYFAHLQTGRDEAKEVRAFGLGGWLATRFDGLYATYLHDLRKHVLRRGLLSLVGQLGSAIVLAGTLFALVALIDRGEIGVAEAGAAIVAIRLLASQVQALFRGTQSIFESGLFLDDLDPVPRPRRGRRVEEAEGPEPPQRFDLLRVEDVTFRYPGADRPMPSRVSTSNCAPGRSSPSSARTAPARPRSPSSSRASTSRTRDASSGTDGDMPRFRPVELRQRIARGLPGLRALPAAGDATTSRSAAIDVPAGPRRCGAAAAAAGAETMLDALPLGYDTVLGPQFNGGTDLSVGQWQRVALARAFYRDAPFVILDEPTAALDPRAEHDLFARSGTLLAGRTVLLISHRFSTVRTPTASTCSTTGASSSRAPTTSSWPHGRYAELFRLQAELADPWRFGHAVDGPGIPK